MIYYDGFHPIRRRLSPPISFLLLLLLSSSLLGILLVATTGHNHPSSWLSFLYFLSYIKLFISTIKGIPQALLNYTRKTTRGGR